jgi:hypothetical protein
MTMRYLIGALLMALALGIALITRPRLQRFLTRGCSGREWHRRFPDAGSPAIRRFLGVFSDAFLLPVRHRLKFSPSDKVLEIYEGLYPFSRTPDALELETFERALRREYGMRLGAGDRDITLGEIFSRAEPLQRTSHS